MLKRKEQIVIEFIESVNFKYKTEMSGNEIYGDIAKAVEIWDDYRKTAFQKRKKSESELDLLDGRISEILTELEQENERVTQLHNLEKALSEALKTRISAEKHLKNKNPSIHT